MDLGPVHQPFVFKHGLVRLFDKPRVDRTERHERLGTVGRLARLVVVKRHAIRLLRGIEA